MTHQGAASSPAAGGEEANKPSWTFGTGATPLEKGLVYATSTLGCGTFAWLGRDLNWTWWQWTFGLLLVWDIAGGVVANGLDPVKLFYHSPLTFNVGPVRRFLHHPVGFTAAHPHTILVGLLFSGASWWWGLLWYLWLLGVIAVEYSPERRQLPWRSPSSSRE